MTLGVFVCPDVEGECGKGAGAVGRQVPGSSYGGRTRASAVTPGGAGPAAPQGSLLILPTALSSAARTSLAQRRGPGATGLAGGKPPPSLHPLSGDHWGSFRLARQR